MVFSPNKVKILLIAKKRTKEDLCAYLEITKEVFYKILECKVNISANRLAKMAEFFGIDINELYEGVLNSE